MTKMNSSTTMMRYVALLSTFLVIETTAFTTSSGTTVLTKQSHCCSFRSRPAGRTIWTSTTTRYVTETMNEHELNSEKLVSRRDALTAGAALLTFFQLASTTTTVNAVETTTTSLSIDASWSAVDGLNSNNNFVAFDPSAYKAMKDDPTRTPLFEKSIIRLLGSDPESKTVLDLGTGPFALFAILAAQAGAGKVYAVEADPQAAQSARATIQRAGYDDIITVLQGFSTDISLPEKADLCIAEIVGSIASEEGAYATICDAHQRLVKNPTSPNAWIPNRIQTYAAPASYSLHNLFGPPEFDWDKLNEPVRFNCRDTGLELLADPVLLEDVAFYNIMDKDQQDMVKKPKELVFTIDKLRMEGNVRPLYDEFRRGNSSPADSERLAAETAHSLSGIALWPRLVLDDDVVIDSRSFPAGNHQRSHWQTVLPIMASRPVSGLKGGETVVVTAEFDLPACVTKSPKYRLDGKVVLTS
jgi:hypothetical protein